MWRRRWEKCQDANISEHDRCRGGSITVWAGISRGGRPYPHIVMRGLVTGGCYKDEILDIYVRPYADPIVHHRGRRLVVTGWCRTASNRRPSSVVDWPARSSDFNPIEHVWNRLQVATSWCLVQPATLVKLANALTEQVWNNLEMTVIQRLIGSMRRRWQAVC